MFIIYLFTDIYYIQIEQLLFISFPRLNGDGQEKFT